MFENNQIEFNKEQENKLKEALTENWFKYLNSKVNMYDEDADIETKIGHIKEYIKYYCKSPDEDIQKTVEKFFGLLEDYEQKRYREPLRDDKGLVNLLDSGFNSGNAFYTGKIKLMQVGKGTFREGIYISTDGKEHIKKRTMDLEPQMNDFKHRKQLRYNGVIANQVFKSFGEESATYLPAIKFPPYYYIISENFLKENQELITFDDLYHEKDKECYKHSEILKLLEGNIRIRYKNSMDEKEYNELIKKLELQYSKQAFIKKIIGLGDEKIGNLGIVLTTSGEEMEIPQIDMSPAFDLDMSFNIADEANMYRITTDNEKNDIKSFVEEFKKVDGFSDFITNVINIMKKEDELIDDIINKSYEVSKAKYFKDEDNITNYKNYLKARFQETRQAYNELYLENRGEEK